MSFSEMLGVLGVSNSFLTYHLENLGELVGKIDDGKYRLSSFGEAAIATMAKVEDIPTTASKMSEPKVNETKPKRVVGRSVAIALGIICILLIAFTAYFAVTGISAQNSYNNLQNQNKQLQTWLNGNETLLSQAQANSTNLQNIANLDESEPVFSCFPNSQISLYEIWLRMPDQNSSGMGVPFFKYAGYLVVEVSATTDTTVEFSYTFQSLNYDSQVDCGTNGTAIFPVLPSSRGTLAFGNGTTPYGTTANITVTYYY